MRHTLSTALAASSALFLGGAAACAAAPDPAVARAALHAAQDADAPVETATAPLIGLDGEQIGQVRLWQSPAGVLIRIEAEGLEPGWRAAHLHETADCSADDFSSAGDHINPDGAAHGLLNPDGPEAGDLPNVHVGADGRLSAEILASRVSLNGSDDAPALKDEDGSAFVLHAHADDHHTQPTGGSHDRIACAEIGG